MGSEGSQLLVSTERVVRGYDFCNQDWVMYGLALHDLSPVDPASTFSLTTQVHSAPQHLGLCPHRLTAHARLEYNEVGAIQYSEAALRKRDNEKHTHRKGPSHYRTLTSTLA